MTTEPHDTRSPVQTTPIPFIVHQGRDEIATPPWALSPSLCTAKGVPFTRAGIPLMVTRGAPERAGRGGKPP
ncbi:TPA: hypothetical protein ACQ8UR_004818 [Escherichia coli]|nr:hypothetical protein [Escherichia coli]